VKFWGGRRLALACALSISCGLFSGAWAAGGDVRAHATFSLLANVENKSRRLYSDRYRINVSEDRYVLCAETADASERMCTNGDIRIGRHDVDLFEQNFTRFIDGVPVIKGISTTHLKFEIIFQSSEAVVIYSQLNGMFVLMKTK
jgi:hypothetical protein